MSKLIIAEKPSVAKSIASALGASSRADGFYEGSGLLVSWCVGHLVSPMDAGGYDERFKKWRYDDLPILPEPFRYVLAPGKEDAFENLRALMDRSDVDTIVNACDAGREGELIFRLVYELAGCRKPVLRLWISSMEDSAIREGFSELRPGTEYEALYQSALCRQRADWLVGINATRLFSVLYHRTLNVGRVQTPTLSLLAARGAKIALFQKEKYHHVHLTLAGAEAVSERFTDPAEAEQAAAIGPVDAVLVPVGGVYTVDAAGAKAVCDALHPRCVVPMHYHHAPYGLTEVDSVEPFLELWPAEAVHHLQGAAFELTKQTAGVMVPSF